MTEIHDRWTVLPHGPLEVLGQDILTVTGDITMPLGNFPRRMTAVRLAGGDVAIFSAMALSEPEMATLEAFGRLRFLIVPDGGHRLDARIFLARYPAMRVLAPAGARDAVTEAVPVDATDDVLGDPATRFVAVAGTEARDSALIVTRPDGTTLIVNDVIGHVLHPHGMGAQVMARLFCFGVHGPRVPRTAGRLLADKGAFAAQLRAWADLPDLRRVVVSHGEPITNDPPAALRAIADAVDSG